MEAADVIRGDSGREVWRKSSYSAANGGNCVEVGKAPAGAVAIRDSKNPGVSLTFPRDTWIDFLAEVRLGKHLA